MHTKTEQEGEARTGELGLLKTQALSKAATARALGMMQEWPQTATMRGEAQLRSSKLRDGSRLKKTAGGGDSQGLRSGMAVHASRYRER